MQWSLLGASIFALVLIANPASAKIYKWVDENGNVQFTQSPPPKGKAVEVKPRYNAVSDEAAKSRLDALRSKDKTTRESDNLAEKEAVDGDAYEARKKENCTTARKNLKILNSSGQVQAKGSDGKPFYLNDDAKAKKLAQTNAQIAEFCK
jgi:hypothetical protein